MFYNSFFETKIYVNYINNVVCFGIILILMHRFIHNLRVIMQNILFSIFIAFKLFIVSLSDLNIELLV